MQANLRIFGARCAVIHDFAERQSKGNDNGVRAASRQALIRNACDVPTDIN